MELKAFIKATLNDVMDAVQETIEERKKASKHGYVNPKVHAKEMEVDTIKFDIAVSTGTKTQGGLDAALEVFSVKLGGKGGGELENSNVSRIEFTLGVSWPHTQILDATKLKRA